jgi:hypothetical protein
MAGMFDDVNKAIQSELDKVLGVPPAREHDGRHYILVGEEVIPCGWQEWAAWFENNDNRRVAETDIDGEQTVSTVCLGLNHNYRADHKVRPLIFETMVFGGKYGDYQWRYSTLEAARAGHAAVVACLENDMEPDILMPAEVL